MKRLILSLSLLCGAAILYALPSPSTTGVVCSWPLYDTNANPGVVGISIYYAQGVVSNFTAHVSTAANQTNLVIMGLQWNTTYSFCGTAYTTNIESDFGPISIYTTPRKPGPPGKTNQATQ